MKKESFVIAIDGPVGSGKGTIATSLSKRLHILYLYTGGMYRSLTLACLRAQINLHDESAVLSVLDSCKLRLDVTSDGATAFYLGDENITLLLIDPDVANATPIVAAHAKVREEMVRRQQKLIQGQSAVIEGRDTTTVVAPDAELKLYLIASLEKRARRRYEQFQTKGIDREYEDVLEETRQRDKEDEERSASPLIQAEDAIVIDSTDDSVDETIDRIINLLRERGVYA